MYELCNAQGCVLKSEDYGEHCHSWEFQSLGLDRQVSVFTHLLHLFAWCCCALANGIYCYSESGTSISEKFNTLH